MWSCLRVHWEIYFKLNKTQCPYWENNGQDELDGQDTNDSPHPVHPVNPVEIS